MWDRLTDEISAAYDGDIQMIDGTSIGAHEQAATLKRGRARSVSRSLARRAHDQDPRGHRPARSTDPARPDGAGQAHDARAALELLDQLAPRTIVQGDKAYDANGNRDLIEAQGAAPTFRPSPTANGSSASTERSTANAARSSAF